MIIHDVAQGSVDWSILRSGIVTASEMENILTPTFEPRRGLMVKSYMAKKLAEWWTGGPLNEFNTLDMDFGHILEGEAIPFIELEYGWKVNRVGFITDDDKSVGCSPDGLIGDISGVEVKCTRIETHFKYLLAGVLPPEYAVQVHASMYVTERPFWKFFSYHRRCPQFLLDVEADSEIQEKIGDALNLFLSEFDQAKQYLIEKNGGPPRRVKAQAYKDPEWISDPNDVPS